MSKLGGQFLPGKLNVLLFMSKML